jgi:hypothetical protein
MAAVPSGCQLNLSTAIMSPAGRGPPAAAHDVFGQSRSPSSRPELRVGPGPGPKSDAQVCGQPLSRRPAGRPNLKGVRRRLGPGRLRRASCSSLECHESRSIERLGRWTDHLPPRSPAARGGTPPIHPATLSLARPASESAATTRICRPRDRRDGRPGPRRGTRRRAATTGLCACMRACVRARARVCVCACVRACAYARGREWCMGVRACAPASLCARMSTTGGSDTRTHP